MLKSNAKISLILALFFAAACGVKSDPLPPESPAEMSQGRPSYKSDDLKPKKQQKDEDSEEND